MRQPPADYIVLQPIFFRQKPEAGQGPDNGIVTDTIGDSDIAGAGEAAAGDHENMVLFGPFHELFFIRCGGLYKQVKGSLGLDTLKSAGNQAIIQGLPVFVISSHIGFLLDAPCHGLL